VVKTRKSCESVLSTSCVRDQNKILENYIALMYLTDLWCERGMRLQLRLQINSSAWQLSDVFWKALHFEFCRKRKYSARKSSLSGKSCLCASVCFRRVLLKPKQDNHFSQLQPESNQSETDAIIRYRKTRASKPRLVKFCRVFWSDWLRKWRMHLEPITARS